MPGHTFTRNAVHQIHKYAGGIPRMINVICDNALAAGMALQRRPVDRACVIEVGIDLKLVPQTSDERPLAKGNVEVPDRNIAPPPKPAVVSLRDHPKVAAWRAAARVENDYLMSRIDQALRIREGASDTSAVSAKPDPSALRQYSREAPERSVRPEHKAESTAVRASGVPPAPKPAAALTKNSMLQARLVSSTPSAVSVEQYRRLAAALHDEQVESGLKTVMITSALPGDGKTLTVVNLALTLAESFARRVLVIDADLRLPTLHTTLEIPNHRGLS